MPRSTELCRFRKARSRLTGPYGMTVRPVWTSLGSNAAGQGSSPRARQVSGPSSLSAWSAMTSTARLICPLSQEDCVPCWALRSRSMRPHRRRPGPRCSRCECLALRKNADAQVAQGRLVERLGDPRQRAKILRDQRNVVVARRDDDRHALLDQARKHREYLLASQIDVQQRAVRMLGFKLLHEVFDIRHRADDLAAEVLQNALQVERDHGLVFGDQDAPAADVIW